MGIPKIPLSTGPLAALECITPIPEATEPDDIRVYALRINAAPITAVAGETSKQAAILLPYPIIRLTYVGGQFRDPESRHLFMQCTLHNMRDAAPLKDIIDGTTIISLQSLIDLNNQRGHFFIFSNLAVKVPGRYKLKFRLVDVSEGQVLNLHESETPFFTVTEPNANPVVPLPSALQMKLTAENDYRTCFSPKEAVECSIGNPGAFRANAAVMLLEPPIAHIYNGVGVIARMTRFPGFGNRQLWQIL